MKGELPVSAKTAGSLFYNSFDLMKEKPLCILKFSGRKLKYIKKFSGGKSPRSPPPNRKPCSHLLFNDCHEQPLCCYVIHVVLMFQRRGERSENRSSLQCRVEEKKDLACFNISNQELDVFKIDEKNKKTEQIIDSQMNILSKFICLIK